MSADLIYAVIGMDNMELYADADKFDDTVKVVSVKDHIELHFVCGFKKECGIALGENLFFGSGADESYCKLHIPRRKVVEAENYDPDKSLEK